MPFLDAVEINDYESLRVNVSVQSLLDITPPGADIKSLEARLSFFPRDDRYQKVSGKDLRMTPDGELQEGEELVYQWGGLNGGEVMARSSFVVESSTRMVEIPAKVGFPFALPEGMEEYVDDTALITSRDISIRRKAAEIAEGSDDLYEIAFRMSEWTRQNINYSLETLTAEATQNATWVLENKKGVCDELTVLFIAMLRSLGVPTKFVSGSSYTNVLGGFGNHAWAEVYFPGYGWIAFDPTYGQDGWVDASHVKMDESVDADKASIKYVWKSRTGEVVPRELDVKASVLSVGNPLQRKVGMKLELLHNQVRPGSFIPVRVDVENQENYYLPLRVYLTKGPEVVEDNERNVLLKPREKGSVFFLIEVPGNLQKNFLYTSDIEVKHSFGGKVADVLEYAPAYSAGLTKEEAEQKIRELSEESREERAGELQLECLPEKDVYYAYESGGMLGCRVKNIGVVNLEGLRICFLERCEGFELLLREERLFNFTFGMNTSVRELKVHVLGGGVSKYAYAGVQILEKPEILVEELSYPEEIGYGEDSALQFSLSSWDEIQNIHVIVSGQEVFQLPAFSRVHQFKIPFEGSFFYGKKAHLQIAYEDRNGEVYEHEQPLQIEVVDVPWWARIAGWVRGLLEE